MTATEQIHVLKRPDLAATNVLWDRLLEEGRVVTFRVGEVHLIQLGARESNGLLFLEPSIVGSDNLQGLFPGVFVGGN